MLLRLTVKIDLNCIPYWRKGQRRLAPIRCMLTFAVDYQLILDRWPFNHLDLNRLSAFQNRGDLAWSTAIHGEPFSLCSIQSSLWVIASTFGNCYERGCSCGGPLLIQRPLFGTFYSLSHLKKGKKGCHATSFDRKKGCHATAFNAFTPYIFPPPSYNGECGTHSSTEFSTLSNFVIKYSNKIMW